MSNRQTRKMYRSRLNTPVPSKITKREKDGSDEGSSTSADESGGEAWNSKNDGKVIKQAHYGGKRRRTGRGKGLKKATVGTDKRRRKRVKSESIDVDPKEDIEDKATEQEEEEVNATTIEVEDQGNQAELEDEVPEQEPEPTTRRSGRATKTPERFDEVRFQPFGAPAPPAGRANITKALGKLKESRAPSRRAISPSGSPDPIASFSDDHDHDMAIDPVDQGPPGDIPISTDLPNPPLASESPPKPKMGRPRKSILKPKTPSAPRKKRGKVTIDESKNITRTIKIISSTSSDIGRHPSLPIQRTRGPKKFGVRSRRTVPVMGISPYTGKRAVQRYEYVVSSDSTESEDEDMVDPAEFREWIKMKREQEKKNGAFLLTLAARISDSPNTSSTLFPLPSPPPPPPLSIPSTTRPPTLPPPPEPTWTKPFSLTPIRPPPPINPNHPPHQEQEKVWKMFVDTVCTEWEWVNDPLLRQVKVFQSAGNPATSLAPGSLSVGGPSPPGANISPTPVAEEEDLGSLSRARQEVSMLAGPQASLTEPIARPGLDFEKSCERLAGLEIADRAMSMRLHIPAKRSTKF